MEFFFQEENLFVGLCAMIRTSSNFRSIGYRFLKSYWGKGFGTEVTHGLIEYLKQDKSIAKIEAAAVHSNIASKKILEKYMIFTKDELDPDTNSYESHYEIILTK